MSKKKKYTIWIIVIVAVIGGFLVYRNFNKTQTEYTAIEAMKGDLAVTVSVTGELVPPEKTDLAFKRGGQVLAINFETGDTVKKGDLIARVDIGILGAELEKARQIVRNQEETLNNMKERDDTYNHEQREAQRATIKSAEADVTAIRREIGDTYLYSPVDGILIERNIDKGELVVAATAIISVAEIGDLEIEANIPESDIVKVALGQKTDASFDSLSQDEIFEAEVVKIDPASTVIQDVVYYKTKFKMARQDIRLKSGMSADLNIKTAEKKNVLIIPERAVKEENGREMVEILLPENQIEKREVVTGMKGDEGMVEIVSGLKVGEKVVTFAKNQ